MFSNFLLIHVPCLITSLHWNQREFILRLVFQFFVGWTTLPNYLITLKSNRRFILSLIFQFFIGSTALPNCIIILKSSRQFWILCWSVCLISVRSRWASSFFVFAILLCTTPRNFQKNCLPLISTHRGYCPSLDRW